MLKIYSTKKCFQNLAKSNCYCEIPNGFGTNSGIICERSGTFQKALLCGLDTFCSGPSTKKDADIEMINFCKIGDTPIF